MDMCNTHCVCMCKIYIVYAYDYVYFCMSSGSYPDAYKVFSEDLSIWLSWSVAVICYT